MKKAFELLAFGEVLLRLSPPGNERLVQGETLQKQVGGAELNVVSGVSLLGLRTGIISKLPKNNIGAYAKTVSVSAGSATTSLYMTIHRMPALAYIIMKTGHTRENRGLYMTGGIPL